MEPRLSSPLGSLTLNLSLALVRIEHRSGLLMRSKTVLSVLVIREYPFHCREVAFVRAPEMWAFYGAFYRAPNLTLNTKKRVKYYRDSFLSPLLETLYKRECFYIELTLIYFSSFHLSCDIKNHVITDSQ